jgi:predicted CoA-binding protein
VADKSPDTGPAIDRLIRETLRSVSTIAVVGASGKPDRASHQVMQFLQRKGFRCVPVNPRLAGGELLRERAYATLADVPLKIDMVDVFRNSADAGPVTDEAIAAGARVVWMQLGVVNEAAAARARAAGLTVIMDRCPAIEWNRLGL